MNNTNIDKQLFIIDNQLVESILYMISLVVSIIIIFDQRKSVLNQKRLISEEDSKIITLTNKLFLFLLAIWSIYLSYKSYEFAKDTNQNTSSLKLQIFVSFIAIIGSIIELYIVTTDFQNTSFQIANIENIEL